MKLVASTVCRNEAGRYLTPFLEHLAEFCDEIRLLDDGSDDGSFAIAAAAPGVNVLREPAASFLRHEGAIRQRLLDWTLEADPSHVIAIDCDELVADGPALRQWIEAHKAPVYTLCMTEIWNADQDHLHVRCDGAWSPSEAPIVYAVPPAGQRGRTWAIDPRAGACGREPVAVRHLHHKRQSSFTDIDILHFGWANRSQRAARHARYHDASGFGHNPRHIESIMFGDDQVSLEARPWPAALGLQKAGILATVRA